MAKRRPEAPGACECGPIATERNRYFTGKYMTARDFADEQRYVLSRHRLHNRLLHGWGVVCGLEVVRHPDEACARRWIVVRAGIAIDCCGRELILCRDTAFKLPLPWPEEPGRPCTACQEDEAAGEPALDLPFLVGLRCRETPVDYVPVLYGECCDADHKEANRIEECPEIVAIRYDEAKACWGGEEQTSDCHCRDDCGGDDGKPARGCCEPECPCDGVVPLALIRRIEDKQQPDYAIEQAGRRTLTDHPVGLTHIVETSWEHGGEVSLGTIRDPGRWNKQLKVRFDRKLAPAAGDATGINRFTFVVQYGGTQGALEFLDAAQGFPCVDPTDTCVAIFEIDDDKLRERPPNIVGYDIYVTLRCDFILDCRGNPIDGDHLRGRLPTGDGVAGGIFESWFHVTSDQPESPAPQYP